MRDPDGAVIGTFEGGGISDDVLVGLAAKKTGTYALQLHARAGAGTGLLRAITP